MSLSHIWGSIKAQITKVSNFIDSFDQDKLCSPSEVENLKAKIEALRVAETKIQDLTPQLESLVLPEDIKFELDRITLLSVTIYEMLDQIEATASNITSSLDNADTSPNNPPPPGNISQNDGLQVNDQPQSEGSPFTPRLSNAGIPLYSPSSPFENLMAMFFQQQNKTNEMFSAALLERRTSTPSPATDAILENLTTIVRNLAENQTTSSNNARLPTLSVPQFSGDFAGWLPFKDMYISTIHNNNKISKIHKMQYLLSYLTGDAKCLIESIEICEDNYDAAWQSLINRFDDTNALVDSNIKRLMSLPKLLIESAKALSQMHSIANSIWQSLRKIKVTGGDHYFIYILKSKLDPESQKLWARTTKGKLSTWDDFNIFLIDRVRELNNCPSLPQMLIKSKANTNPKSSTLLTADGSAEKCKFCQEGSHKLYMCTKFRSSSLADRFTFIRNENLCRNCITETHLTRECTRSGCKKCNNKHNTLLHGAFDAVTANAPNPSNNSVQNSSSSPATNLSTEVSNTDSDLEEVASLIDSPNIPTHTVGFTSNQSLKSFCKVFLGTAIINIMDRNGEIISCRAVIDNGSQINLMTEGLAQRLKLPKIHYNFGISGILDLKSKGKYKVRTQFSSREGSVYYPISCNVISKITGNLPNWQVDPKDIPIPDHLFLADPSWHISQSVDILIGGGLFAQLEQDESFLLGKGFPKLKKSHIGWILFGEHASESPSSDEIVFSDENEPICALTTLSSIDRTFKQFVDVEDIPSTKPLTLEQKAVEEFYVKTTTRNADGRYVVKLPFKTNLKHLDDNKSNAIAQLLRLERRLLKNPDLRVQYNAVIREYLDLGFMEPVPPQDMSLPSYYMPHHGVIKEASTTTKLRVVYNASFKSNSGISLNDTLKLGAVVQPDLTTILLLFRRYIIALICDIVKMYPQILLHPSDTNYQRIVFRFSPDDPIMHLRLTGVCFGESVSPFLATRTVNQISYDEGDKFPLAAPVLLNNFYMDDCLVSFPEVNIAIKTRDQLIEIFKSAKMELAKWSSNNLELLGPIPGGSGPKPSVEISADKQCSTKALGLKWDTQNDTFSYEFTPTNLEVTTKRTMLSLISTLFDPLGLVGPVIIEAKLLLQCMWRQKLGWDDPAPDDILEKWQNLIAGLQQIHFLSIPRWVSDIQFPKSEEFHVFVDSSMYAYGAAVYYVTIDEDGKRCSRLLIAKSKIAPMEATTIPKLELFAAVVGAKLIRYVLNVYSNVKSYYCWSDSMIVLGQIYSTKEKHDVTVGHRISQIQDLTEVCAWRHVRSELNPADIISRGSTPQDLMQSTSWWTGPPFLILPPSEWPPAYEKSSPESDENRHDALIVNTSPPARKFNLTVYEKILENYSDFPEMVRATAISRRFLSKNSSGPLTMDELSSAEKTLIRWEQQRELGEVISSLQRGTFYTAKMFDPLKSLRPFIDHEGLIRVQGRLTHSSAAYSTKHPLLLPKGELAYWIAKEEHFRLLHAGPKLLLANLHKNYWPINGGRLVHNVLKQCVRCCRVKPKMEYQMMADLPPQRIPDDVKPFSQTGVDYAGPFLIRYGTRRTKTLTKAYICVFVCLATKAVHCDVVGSLTTKDFIEVLERFSGRRPTPCDMFSDNATYFVGADKELGVLFEDRNNREIIIDGAARVRINWHFSPPRSPHHGGLWEAAIKSFKYHFKRVARDEIFTFVELYTLVVKIEGVLNSRPITPLSTDPSEAIALTPGHFLMKEHLEGIPSKDLQHVPSNHLDRWQRCQKMFQEFCRRWKLEYLTTLQKRTKWQKDSINLKIGDVVVICEENSPTYRWPLGRIVEVHTGRDNKVRIVTVQTARGTYKRAVTKLSKLPIEEGLPPSIE